MLVTLELTVNGSADPIGRYLTWTPYPAQVRLVAPDSAGPVTVLLRNAADNVGRVAFRTDCRPRTARRSWPSSLPVDGSPVDLLLSG